MSGAAGKARPGPWPFLRLEVTAMLAAFQFLTLAPAIIKRPFTAPELGRAIAYYPVVGLALGALLTGLRWGLGLALPPPVVSAAVLAAWAVATGGLHLDGFLDSCDGVLGGFTPEDRLRILRDEHKGAYALIGGVLILLLKYTSLAASPSIAILLAPLLGRWAMATAVVAFPYARASGLGRDIKDGADWPHAALGTAFAVTCAWMIAGWLGLLALGVAALSLLAIARYVLARLPGLTGDIYGAICELTELAVLLLFASRLHL
jgi:adenosylcobinamide-GDP ribazoletransferase